MRKLFASFAMFLAIVLGVVVGAQPAQASVYGCPDGGYVCFYNYESFNPNGGIYWWYHFTGAGNCHVMPTSGQAGWTNGKVYNATTSILLNWTGTNTLERTIYYYDANTCSIDDYKFASVVYPGQLRTELWRLADIGWNDRIGSFKIV